MIDFIILALVACNIGQFVNRLDLKAQLNNAQNRNPVVPFRVGVTPEQLKEGHENNMHRKPPFPSIP
jgi:hypothetical protein